MKAVILAAGMGTRLGTLVPKPLTSIVDEKTILDYQIENLSSAMGKDNIIIVVGYKKEIIMEKFPELLFIYNAEFTLTNTSKSLLKAIEKVHEEDVLWMNGDVYFEKEVISDLIKSKYSCMLVDNKKCSDEEIKYTLDANGNIFELSKKVEKPLGEALGINCIKKADLEKFKAALREVEKKDYFEKALENLTTKKAIVLKPISVGNHFCAEIDFEEDLKTVQEHIRKFNSK